MAFCPYCGKSLQEGEVCSCTSKGSAQSAQPSGNGFVPPAGQNGGVSFQPSAPKGGFDGQSTQGAPAPQGGFNPQQGGFEPQQGGFTPPQGNFIPPQGNFNPQQGNYGPQQGGFNPQQGYYPQQGYAPYPPRPAGPSFFTPLLERMKQLFSKDASKAVRGSLSDNGLSWIVVISAFVLLAPLTVAFGMTKFVSSQSYYLSFGAMLSNTFGPLFGLSLLVNILVAGMLLGVVMLATLVFKKPLSFMGALNLVATSLIPAVVLTFLGLIFSFFWPAGTLILAVISAVCTIMILCAGVSMHVSSEQLVLTPIIMSVSMVVLYLLIVFLVMGSQVLPYLS